MDASEAMAKREAAAEIVRRITEIQKQNALNRQPISTPTPTPMAVLADLVQPIEAPLAAAATGAAAPIRGFYDWLGKEANRLTSWGPRKPGNQAGVPGGDVPFL